MTYLYMFGPCIFSQIYFFPYIYKLIKLVFYFLIYIYIYMCVCKFSPSSQTTMLMRQTFKICDSLNNNSFTV